MYGKHDVPFTIEQEGITLSIKKISESSCYYSRTYLEERVEKSLFISKGDIFINPIEPLNTPKAMTPYLCIEFDKMLFIEPKATKKIFLTFPIEIAVFIRLNKIFNIVDTFSVAKQKFTLYGEPKNGVICKYWKSEVYETMPSPDPIHEGIIELNLFSSSADWEQVTKAVFNAYGMKVFYSSHLVGMKAKMRVEDDGIAETEFQDSSPERGMKKSLEAFPARKLSMVTTNFIMEYGL
jgi:hypothetical protein